MNVTGCRYAQFYDAIGAPGLGIPLVCSADFTMADGYGDGKVELTRTQTIIAGRQALRFPLPAEGGEKEGR